MSFFLTRRAVVLGLLVVALAACGGSGGQAVRTATPGSGPAFGPVSTTAPARPPTTGPVPTTTAGPGTTPTPTPTPTPSSSTTSTTSTTSTAVPDPGRRAQPSPIANLTPADLRRVVTAPRRNRTLTGPVADRVVLPDGRTVWRVTIGGRFPLRSARLSVTVADRQVGEGIATPDGTALVAVTVDGTALVAGARVAWGPPEVAPTEAGRLAVIR